MHVGTMGQVTCEGVTEQVHDWHWMRQRAQPSVCLTGCGDDGRVGCNQRVLVSAPDATRRRDRVCTRPKVATTGTTKHVFDWASDACARLGTGCEEGCNRACARQGVATTGMWGVTECVLDKAQDVTRRRDRVCDQPGVVTTSATERDDDRRVSGA